VALGGASHLPIRSPQQLSKVLPTGKGLQYGQKVPTADGCPESVGLRRGPTGKPAFHILDYNVAPAGIPTKTTTGSQRGHPLPRTGSHAPLPTLLIQEPSECLHAGEAESPYMSLSVEGFGPPWEGSWASMTSLNLVFPMFKASWGHGKECFLGIIRC
jgi:hypothetical protein